MEEIIESYALLLEIGEASMMRNGELTRPHGAIISALELTKAKMNITPEAIDKKSFQLFGFRISGRKGSGASGGKNIEKRLDDYLNKYPHLFLWDGQSLKLDPKFEKKLLGQHALGASSSTFNENLDVEYLPTKADVEYAYRQISYPGKEIKIDILLDQIGNNIMEEGKSLQNNWRKITERNIGLWWK